MTTSIETAAKILRTCQGVSVIGDTAVDPYDVRVIAAAYLEMKPAYDRERDKRPVTEEFAKSVAVDVDEHGCYKISSDPYEICYLHCRNNLWELFLDTLT